MTFKEKRERQKRREETIDEWLKIIFWVGAVLAGFLDGCTH